MQTSQSFNDFLAYKTAQRAEYQRVYGNLGSFQNRQRPPEDDVVEIFERDGTVKRTKLIRIGGQR